MTEQEVSRTLVKSPPELWAECSDASSLARHLDQFGELRITRLEPESTVAWEGEHASGTVRLEPAGWGTRVVLNATSVQDGDELDATSAQDGEDLNATWAQDGEDEEPAPQEPEPLPPPPPRPSTLPPAAEADLQLELERAPGFFRRLVSRFRSGPVEPVADRPPIELRPAEDELVATRATIDEGSAVAVLAPPGAATATARGTAIASPEAQRLGAALTAALDSLGQAHHRPFSRG